MRDDVTDLCGWSTICQGHGQRSSHVRVVVVVQHLSIARRWWRILGCMLLQQPHLTKIRDVNG